MRGWIAIHNSVTMRALLFLCVVVVAALAFPVEDDTTAANSTTSQRIEAQAIHTCFC